MSKAYRLSNGMTFDTEVELKAYIRGLEHARVLVTVTAGSSIDPHQKISQALEDAHNAKSAGVAEEKPADTTTLIEPKDGAEQGNDSCASAETQETETLAASTEAAVVDKVSVGAEKP